MKMAAFFNSPIYQLSGLNIVIGNQCPSDPLSYSCKGCDLLFLVCFTTLHIVNIKTISSPELNIIYTIKGSYILKSKKFDIFQN